MPKPLTLLNYYNIMSFNNNQTVEDNNYIIKGFSKPSIYNHFQSHKSIKSIHHRYIYGNREFLGIYAVFAYYTNSGCKHFNKIRESKTEKVL